MCCVNGSVYSRTNWHVFIQQRSMHGEQDLTVKEIWPIWWSQNTVEKDLILFFIMPN